MDKSVWSRHCFHLSPQINERFGAAPADSHFVAICRRIAVRIGRRHSNCVIAGSDRSFSFKAVIAFNGGGSSVYGHSRRLIGGTSDRHDTNPALPGLQLVEVVDCVTRHKAVDCFGGAVAGQRDTGGVTISARVQLADYY